NVALTAPYRHDGSTPNLGALLDFYADGGLNVDTGANAGDGRANVYKSQFVKGIDMTAQERAELLAFLHSLTDPAFLERAGHQDPFAD
ncbi:MAG: di-heme enzyme, partial [Gammaproteobacteria bacterium]|nr:di-heme enzyme [Gammaproteobacteria bacterium]